MKVCARDNGCTSANAVVTHIAFRVVILSEGMRRWLKARITIGPRDARWLPVSLEPRVLVTQILNTCHSSTHSLCRFKTNLAFLVILREVSTIRLDWGACLPPPSRSNSVSLSSRGLYSATRPMRQSTSPGNSGVHIMEESILSASIHSARQTTFEHRICKLPPNRDRSC